MFGWVEAGEDLRFPLEPGEAIRISGEGVRQDLQRDVAAQLRVGGAIDLAHAAFADEGGDVVVAEAGADGQGHVVVWLRSGPILRPQGQRLQRAHRNGRLAERPPHGCALLRRTRRPCTTCKTGESSTISRPAL